MPTGLGYGFRFSERIEDSEHLFCEGGCCGYRLAMFPGTEPAHFLYLHLAVFVIL
jgi:hypothetical protein